jgi:hypothetical protein
LLKGTRPSSREEGRRTCVFPLKPFVVLLLPLLCCRLAY